MKGWDRGRLGRTLLGSLATGVILALAGWHLPPLAPFRYRWTPLLSLKRVTDANPQDRQAWKELGLRLAREGDYELAEPALRSAFGLDNTDPDVACALGEVLLTRGRVPDAFQILKQATETHPEFAPGRMLMGRLYRTRGSYHHAAEQFEAVVTGGPEALRGEAHYELARCYLQMQQVAKARDAALAAVKADGSDPRYRSVLGATQAAIGEIPAAIENLKAAWTLSRSDPAIAANYASLLLAHQRGVQDLDAAGRVIEQLAAAEDAHPATPFLQGKLCALRGDWPGAVRHLEEARRTTPERDEIYFALSQAYSRSQRPAESAASLAEYRKRQELRREMDEVQIALGSAASKSPLYERLARLQLRAGDTASARASLVSALQSSPGSARLLQQLQVIDNLQRGRTPSSGTVAGDAHSHSDGAHPGAG